MRRQRAVDSHIVQFVRDGFARYSREEIEQALPMFERFAPGIPWRKNMLSPVQHRLREMMTSWRVRVMARCSVDQAGMELVLTHQGREDRWAMMLERAAAYGLSEHQTWDSIRGTDLPDGWLRYPSLRIEEVWLSDHWSDQRAGLESRYRCPVNFVAGGAEWIQPFVEPRPQSTRSAGSRLPRTPGAA